MSTPERPTPRGGRPGVPDIATLWRTPLPHLADRPGIRLICRSLLTLFHGHVRAFHGLEHIAPSADPFLLVLNHSQRPEAILVPAWLCFHRGGRMVHFMADWNFLMIPGVGGIIRAHDPIVVTRKAAKPAFLNRFKSRYAGALPPFEEAARRLQQGRCVGVFPEGTTNRHPAELLRGYHGAAQLAVDTGARVIPGGIRFDSTPPGRPISDRAPFSVHFGAPISGNPSRNESETSADPVRQKHHEIMTAISTLSGKRWQAQGRRTKYAFDED
jgi:1-acyl-sn-glycerol-3-phosphate acyltransferase